MRHTSIRLSEENVARIKQTGKSPTTIINKALDLFFGIPPDEMEPARELIEEHVRLYHRAQPEHEVSTQDKHVVPQSEHKQSAQGEHTLSTPEARSFLEEIMKDLEANHEPMLSELADRFKVPAQTISKAISPFGIRAQETKRAGVAGRYFTQAMKTRIRELLDT